MRKKGLVMRELGWWIIALVILVIVIIGLIYLNKQGISITDWLMNLLRFGR
ncbi:MAG: hypothetical protein JSW08_01200 [archaeon]|nr:MAG: hypothetical protein JSW08_01200 [archaeon]